MLKGKVAVVSGAAQGLGKSFTHILLENGAQVNRASMFIIPATSFESKVSWSECLVKTEYNILPL